MTLDCKNEQNAQPSPQIIKKVYDYNKKENTKVKTAP